MDGAMLGGAKPPSACVYVCECAAAGSSCKTGMSRGEGSTVVAVQGLPPESSAKNIHDMFIR